ncbi:hypothetical protein A4X13_0g5351 [Tilletia indica]|uniref:AAA+ ATPase domain-containing protein n=1 Tax=Tilletia indica TaxID=43049 RepID=A0A177TRA2_9BASI|nr:hypothetical protein A4X13_0g5351 [Tilletia indica]
MLLRRSAHMRTHTAATRTGISLLPRTTLRSLATATSPTADPLAVYKERVARKEIEESEDQIRALIHLRRLSRALNTYTPPAHLLSILARPPPPSTQDSGSSSSNNTTADPRTAALVQWLTLPQQLAESPAPQGLLLTGPPGTGKSMLADLFFDSLPLPPTRKWRRHYHHLLLEIYRIVWQEAERRRIAARGAYFSSSPQEDDGADLSSSGPRRTRLPQRGTGVVWKRELAPDGQSTVWNRILEGMPFFRSNALSEAPNSSTALTKSNLASSSSSMDLAHTTLPLYAAAELFLRHGHVLLFDELQLVDVASANLLKRVLEAYWRLGGVVVGTSNRLPEELYTRGVQREAMLGFLEALRERCPVHEMRDDRDYRRRPADFSLLGGGSAGLGRSTYFLSHEQDLFDTYCADLIGDRKGSPAEVQVYSRKVPVPFSLPPTETHPSLARFSFSDLFDTALGPADYLQLASTYHTLILTSLPVLTLLQKNQARRLITFLDAVYEAGCRLVVCAQAEPDRLFFPEASEEAERMVRGEREERTAEADDVVDMSAKGSSSPFTSSNLAKEQGKSIDLDTSQLIQSEVFSEAAQDTEEGFRPNIVAYSEGDDARGEAARRRRSGGAASARASAGAGKSEAVRKEQALKGVYAGLKMERDAKGQPIVARDAFGFANLAIFTGEEERFAFQRAVSRLFEMSTPQWSLRKRWRPLEASALNIWGATSKSNRAADEIIENAERERERRLAAVKQAVALAEAQARREMEAGMGVGMGSSDFADEASFEQRTHRDRNTPTSHPVPPKHPQGQPEDQLLDDESHDMGPRIRLHPAFPTEHHANERSVTVEREGPPRLSPVHVWGVQKWGAKAGKWGMGADAYEGGEGEGEEGQKGSGEGAGSESGGKR